MVFRGENADPEVWQDYRGAHWQIWLGIFFPLINNRHGYFAHYPFPGSLMEQPSTTMRILQTIMGEYHKHLAEVNKIPGA